MAGPLFSVSFELLVACSNCHLSQRPQEAAAPLPISRRKTLARRSRRRSSFRFSSHHLAADHPSGELPAASRPRPHYQSLTGLELTTPRCLWVATHACTRIHGHKTQPWHPPPPNPPPSPKPSPPWTKKSKPSAPTANTPTATNSTSSPSAANPAKGPTV